jgi:hypothetical protein
MKRRVCWKSREAEPEVGGQRKWSQRIEIQRTKVK